MTPRTKPVYLVSDNRSGSFAEPKQSAGTPVAIICFDPSRPNSPKSMSSPEYVSIVDRSGIAHMRVTIRQARDLHERRLLEPVGNKRTVRAWRLTPGTCIAHLYAALRTGLRDRLPMPEPYTGQQHVADGLPPIVSLKRLDSNGAIVRDRNGNPEYL